MMAIQSIIDKRQMYEKMQKSKQELLYKFRKEKRINTIVDFYKKIKQTNMYHPKKNNAKILTIISCHVNSDIKFDSLKKTIFYLNFESNDVIIINSNNLKFNNEIQEICKQTNIKYFEIDNDNMYDFGKWHFILKNTDISNYNNIVFTNDSFIMYDSIHHFYNLMIKTNVDFYGYNDSTQCEYHYQSYLFGLKNNVIPDFINIIENNKGNINNQDDVIRVFELKLTHFFPNNDCFLKIGNENFHKTRNIFFESDAFYNKLFENKLLPFYKIKRLT